jgi:two-component system chemotaxis response regulator CheB
MEICEGDEVITTVLGPCVSVCLYSINGHGGGLIHFALPDKKLVQGSHRGPLNFGESAIVELIESVLKIPGISISELRAKITGGAAVTNDSSCKNLGQENASVARKVLNQYKIKIVGEDIGGKSSRKIYFYTGTGRLRVSKVSPTNAFDNGKKKVLIIDDSKPIRDILTKILTSEKLEIVGSASNTVEALPLIKNLRPDVITLDIHMPGKDGVTFLQEYLPHYPIPTVMISSIAMGESDQVLRALESGAVDYIEKPGLDEIKTKKEIIQEKILTASTIRIQPHNRSITRNTSGLFKRSDKVMAIGASTGGTEALKKVLLNLPPNIPPILIVQHIPAVFSTAFAKSLNQTCPFEVKEATNGDLVIPGRVLLAPGGKHMEVYRDKNVLKVFVKEGEPVNRHCPSVDVLFDSAARVLGSDALGIILTGMGNDGANGLLKMKKAGAITIAQDEASSVVFGMPKAAINIGAVDKIESLDSIPELVVKLLNVGKVA